MKALFGVKRLDSFDSAKIKVVLAVEKGDDGFENLKGQEGEGDMGGVLRGKGI